ncbi:BQ2448_2760 [Microbotryum intermedium]|uniref:BQ2448_2760 protein n=1 Tax=Microbotryum intermedium TaxID=269621 RepID=A0A238FBE7_9BASI|nr:BQ2448_2760 [Microbotryum intermedium]
MATSSSAARKAEALQAARTLRALKFARSCALASTWAGNKRRMQDREREIVRADENRAQVKVLTKRRESIGPIRTTGTTNPKLETMSIDRKPIVPLSNPSCLESRPNPSSLGPIRTQSTSNRTVEGVVHIGRQVYVIERATKVTISTVRRVVGVPPVGTREWEVLKPYLLPRRQQEGGVEMERSKEVEFKNKVKIEDECEVKRRTGMRDEKRLVPNPVQSPSTFRFPGPTAHTRQSHCVPPHQSTEPHRRSSIAAAYEHFLRETIPSPRDHQNKTKPVVPQLAPLCWRRGKRIRPLTLF